MPNFDRQFLSVDYRVDLRPKFEELIGLTNAEPAEAIDDLQADELFRDLEE
jgi:hypothetical protein